MTLVAQAKTAGQDGGRSTERNDLHARRGPKTIDDEPKNSRWKCVAQDDRPVARGEVVQRQICRAGGRFRVLRGSPPVHVVDHAAQSVNFDRRSVSEHLRQRRQER